MSGRRCLLALVLLAAALHVAGIAGSLLPAQDGLKFIRVARDFQNRPWVDVIRGSDQHPLYPALIALAEPVVARVTGLGTGPQAWRIAAQAVAALASLALLIPLYGLTRDLFDARIARIAVLIQVILPLPAAIGHDTLSDSLALFSAMLSLWLGVLSLRSNGWKAPVGCGIVAGLGFLARPEVLIVPAAVTLTWVVSRREAPVTRRAVARLGVLGLSFLLMVGTYALVKGEVSEKLALRHALGLGPAARKMPPRSAKKLLPPGLNDSRWDFSPKEEADEPAVATAPGIITQLGLQWAECLCGVFAFFAVWGVARARYIRTLCEPQDEVGDRPAPDPKSRSGWAPSFGSSWSLGWLGSRRQDPSHPHATNLETTATRCLAVGPHSDQGKSPEPSPSDQGARLVGIYLGLFSLILARHALKMGYLSDRHTLTLVVASIPWAAAGTFVCARGIALKLRWSPSFARWAGGVTALALVVVGVSLQSKPAHPSRWGHWAAGHWLAEHAEPGDAVLDTRGWAAFVSGQPSYDYWHVRQALSDSRLRYLVVGTNELTAESRRAATLRAVLAYAAEPVIEFPERRDRPTSAGVRVYRYHRPESWEGIGR